MQWPGAKVGGRHPLNWASSLFALHANRSTHKPARETPRGCQLVYRNGHGDGGTGIWTRLHTAVHRSDRAAVNNRSGPIDVAFAGEPIQEREVHQIPYSFCLPIAQASPARHARTTAEFLRQHLPWYSAAQHEQDAGQTSAIRHTRPSAVRPRGWNRQKRFDKFPQRVGQQHTPTLQAPQLIKRVLSSRFCYAPLRE
jgi:hypothetical protein